MNLETNIKNEMKKQEESKEKQKKSKATAMPPKLDSNTGRIRESTPLRLHVHRVNLVGQAKKIMQQASKSPPLPLSLGTTWRSA